MQPLEIPAQTRLLKANDIRGLGSKVAFNLEDLRHTGDAYVESIRKQVREMLELAESQVESIRKQAHDRGFEQGQRQGLEKASELIEQRAKELADKAVRENLATTLPAMQSAVSALVVERDRWLTEWESTAVRLAAAIAHRLINRHLELDPNGSKEMLRNALQLAAGSPQIRLRLHPEDAVRLGEYGADVVRAMASCGQAQVIPDASLSRGGCIIDTQHGTIDAQIETLLQRIVSELLENQG